jgi:hypothetical protein
MNSDQPPWASDSESDSSVDVGDLPIGSAYIDDDGFVRYVCAPAIPNYWPQVDKECHYFTCAECCFDADFVNTGEESFEDLINEGIAEAGTIPLSPAILPQYIDDLVALIGTDGENAERQLNRLANVLYRRLRRTVSVRVRKTSIWYAKL